MHQSVRGESLRVRIKLPRLQQYMPRSLLCQPLGRSRAPQNWYASTSCSQVRCICLCACLHSSVLLHSCILFSIKVIALLQNSIDTILHAALPCRPPVSVTSGQNSKPAPSLVAAIF